MCACSSGMQSSVCPSKLQTVSLSRMLPCGHSFCSDCLHLLFKPSECAVNCPTCLVSHKVGQKENLENFSKNFALIALAESKHSNAPLLQMKMGLSSTSCDKKKKRHSLLKSPVNELSFSNSSESQLCRPRINSD